VRYILNLLDGFKDHLQAKTQFAEFEHLYMKESAKKGTPLTADFLNQGHYKKIETEPPIWTHLFRRHLEIVYE